MEIRPATYPNDLAAIRALVASVAAADGVEPLGEPAVAELETGPPVGVWGLVANHEPIAAYAHVGEAGIELAVAAGHRDREMIAGLLGGLRDAAAARGILLPGAWIHTDDVADLVAGVDGWWLDRSLYRMECPLPPSARPSFPEGTIVRGFRPRRDESAWLTVNNEAFADHPEQGGWELRDLERRLAWDWFDPEGLRMAWVGERLAAFNWTKLHADGTGEIFVIAASAAQRGRGFGRAIALDGLWDLSERQGARRGMLYVDANNRPAVSLYGDLGFRVVETHRHYRCG